MYVHPFPVINYMKHGFNTFLMFTDLMVVGFPIRLLHTAYTMAFAFIYIIFSLIYHIAGGTDEWVELFSMILSIMVKLIKKTSFSFIFRLGNEYIYPILNWKEPSKVIITATGIYIFLLALAIGLMLIDKLKSVIHRITMPKTQ